MNLSIQAKDIYSQISQPTTKLGDLRKIAKAIKKDHNLAMELWSTRAVMPRQLALLIMDNKQLDQAAIDALVQDMQQHDYDERLQLVDWFLANQLSKNKQLVTLMESWEGSAAPLQRRLFWYHQARLRWMGKTDQSNTEDLLTSIEAKLADEQPEVQWAMNYTAGQIGKFQAAYRDRCIAIGENTGLYKDEVVSKGCTPGYLPEFIAIEVAKLNK